MKILPFTHVSKKGSFGLLHIYKLFLIEGGNSLWETDEKEINQEEIIKEYLEPNGFEGEIFLKNEILLVKVSPNFPFDTFYAWEDNTSAEEVWRTFYRIETDNEKGWMKQAETIKIGQYSLVDLWELIDLNSSAEKV